MCRTICATTLLPAFAADALTPLAEEIAGFDAACPGEKIVATVNPIFVTPRVDASIVRVASTGACFGQVGENDSLVARTEKGWKVLLSAHGLQALSRAWLGTGLLVAGSLRPARSPEGKRRVHQTPGIRRCLTCLA